MTEFFNLSEFEHRTFVATCEPAPVGWFEAMERVLNLGVRSLGFWSQFC